MLVRALDYASFCLVKKCSLEYLPFRRSRDLGYCWQVSERTDATSHFSHPNASKSSRRRLPLFTGDFNGDGVPDLAYTFVRDIRDLLGFGGASPTTVSSTLCAGGVGSAISFADVNNDKKLDAIYNCNGYISVALGNGDGTFQAPAYYAVPNTETPLLVDLNGDGYLDIAAMVIGAQTTRAGSRSAE